MKLSFILTICLIACISGIGTARIETSWSLAQDIPKHMQQMPSIIPTQCSAPMQIQGQVAIDTVINEITEVRRIYQGVQGGCGQINISTTKLDVIAESLLADMSAVHIDAECSPKSSSNVDEPYGNRAEVTCTKLIKNYRAYLIVGIIIDTDGEVAIYFISARD